MELFSIRIQRTFQLVSTGTGMTEDEQQRVFGAFERLSNAAAKDGFGLGFLQPAVIQQPG